MKIKRFLIALTAIVAYLLAGELHAQPSFTFADAAHSQPMITTRIIPTPLATFFDPHASIIKLNNPASLEEFYSRSMMAFMENAYNKPHYANTLSQDARHIVQFLELAEKYALTAEQVYGGIRLFHTKLKETTLIDDTVATYLFDALPELLASYFPVKHGVHKPSAKVIENIILSDLTDHLTAPKQSTEDFFTQLSENLSSNIAGLSDNGQAMAQDRLRAQCLKFFELLLDKTTWYPQHHESIWNNVLKLAHNIHRLVDHRIITHADDRDDLLNTLTNRFIAFLDTCGKELPPAFYEHIENSIKGDIEAVEFLNNEEVDAGKKPKREMVIEALMKAKAQSIAYHKHGIVV